MSILGTYKTQIYFKTHRNTCLQRNINTRINNISNVLSISLFVLFLVSGMADNE